MKHYFFETFMYSVTVTDRAKVHKPIIIIDVVFEDFVDLQCG